MVIVVMAFRRQVVVKERLRDLWLERIVRPNDFGRMIQEGADIVYHVAVDRVA